MALLDGIMGPFLSINPTLAIGLLSFLIALLMTLAYKLTTNQEVMRTLKADMKKFQKQMKDLQKEPEKMMDVQKKAMQKNMEYMKHSMRPTLITLLPLLLIFGWLNANFSYLPLTPGNDFTVTLTFQDSAYGPVQIVVPEGVKVLDSVEKNIQDGTVSWTLNAEEGEYILQFQHAGQEYEKQILVTPDHGYIQPVMKVKNSPLKQIAVGNQKLVLFNLFGWKVGWLGMYIVCSIIFSMSLRKLMKLS